MSRFSNDVPLVIFSSALIAAIACALAAAVPALSGGAASAFDASLMEFALELTAIGLLAAFAHLGRPLRAWRAGVRFLASWLSREVLLAAAFLLALAALAVLWRVAGGRPLFEALRVPTALLALALAATLGLIYRLPARIGWRGPAAVLAPATSAALLCAAILAAAGGMDAVSPPLLWTLVLLDGSFALARLLAYRRARGLVGALAYPGLARWIAGATLLRFAALLAAVLALAWGKAWPAAVALAVTVLADRFLFYASSARLAPQAEVGSLRRQRLRAAAGIRARSGTRCSP